MLKEQELQHTKLKADIFEFFIHNKKDQASFFNQFSERLRKLLNCEQIIYRDLSGLSICCNSPEIEEMWSVPIEYCRQCPHYDIDSPVYANGATEMEDCSKGYRGVPTYEKCPIKSSLTKIVYLDGEPFGYIAVHYLLKYHKFSNFERNTIGELASILSLTVSALKAQKQNAVYKLQEKKRHEEESIQAKVLIDFFTEESESTYSVNLNTGMLTVIKEDPACTELTGSEEEKPYDSTISTLIDNLVFEADKPMMREILDLSSIRAKVAGAQSSSVDYRQVTEDGRPEWFSFTLARLTSDRALLNFADTNERTLKKLASRSLFDNYISIYYCNLEENLITEVKHSPVYEFEEGRSRIAAIDENSSSLIALADKEYRDAFTKFISREHLYSVLAHDDRTEFIYSSHVTGQQRWVKLALHVAERRDGMPVNLIMTFSNVDKEQVEKMKLNGEIAKLHVISDVFTDSFVSTYYIGLEDFSYEIYKRNEYLKGKYPHTDNFFTTLEKYISNEVHPDDRNRMREVFTPDVIRERLKKSDSFSIMIRDLSGGTQKNYRVLVIRGADENHAAVGFMDITAEINAEQEKMRALEEAGKANEASKMKSRFVQNISHDLRTPLNAIVGYSQLLAMPDGYLTEEEKTEFSDYVNNSAEMLTMLVDDVLSISDIEHDILKMEVVDTNCNNVCQKAVNISNMRVPVGVHLYYTSEVDDSFTIKSDAKRIQQILLNFLSNACKHTVEGEIHLHFSTTETPGYVTFSVSDTGTGVSPEKADLIFKRFASMDPRQGSHGLGLDICKDIANRLGGDVGLDKSYTGGARFYLTLPADK